MITSCLFLAVSVSIDALGIGITYAIKGTKINRFAKLILFMISFIVASFSISIGTMINSIFSNFTANLLGAFILILMGLWVILQALNTKENIKLEPLNPKYYNFIIKSLGITIHIIKNPISSDLDKSNKIDAREALYLGIALSLDALCIGIGGSILKINSYVFPILVSCFQFIFISIGNILGKKLNSISSLPDNIWSIISGIILIIIGLLRFL